MQGVYVMVNAHDGQVAEGYGAVSSKKLSSAGRSVNSFGRSAALAASAVAFAALLGLAITSGNHDERVAAEESTFTGSTESYSSNTGMLVAKLADPGLIWDIYWGGSSELKDLTGDSTNVQELLGKPQISTFATSINFPDAATLKSDVGPKLPSHTSESFPSIICVWKGKFEIVRSGLYNFTLASSASGAILKVGDETASVFDGASPVELDNVNLPSGFQNIFVVWKAPSTDTAAAHLSVEYNGPDTNGVPVFVSGVHFADDMDAESRKAASNMVRPGFGVLQYQLLVPNVPMEGGVPSLTEMRNTSLVVPVVGARVETIDMGSHPEFVTKLKNRRFPRNQVLLMVQGLIKIESSGDYNLTVESDSDSAARLFIDNRQVADIAPGQGPTGNGEHNVSESADVTLQAGWHTARLIWNHNSAGESQVLRLLYGGPDTGGDSVPVQGYYLKGVASTGSLDGMRLSDGSEEGGEDAYTQRNWAEHFDQEWLSDNKDKPWRVYDDADWKEEIGDHVDKIVQPVLDYDAAADSHEHLQVPEEVYDHPAPYDHEVVDIGGKGIEWKHKEATGEYAQSVIGAPYDWDYTWDKTPNSAADPSGR